MNNILLSQLNQENINKFLKLLSVNADIQNVNFSYFDINIMQSSMGLSLSHSFFVLNESNLPIGLFLASIKGEFCGILLIYVSPSYRSQGLGNKMLNFGLNLVQNDVKKITLEVFPQNEPAKKLYIKNNFKKTGLILTFRNETHSFYSKNGDISVKKISSFLILPTLKQFGSSRPDYYNWCYNSIYYSKLVDSGLADFVAIYEQSRIIGYFIFVKKTGTIKILDFGIVNEKIHLLFCGISSLITNEMIVLVQLLETDNQYIQLFRQNGFFEDICQEIYIKNL